MLLNREAVSSVIALLTLLGGMAIFIWRTSSEVSSIQFTLRQTILKVEHSAELNKEKQQGFDLLLQSGLNGNTERINHISQRLKAEITALQARVNDLEEFQVKNTAFERRK